MTQFKNFIGGEWVDGNDSAPNVNPSDTSDVIGHFARASADQTQKAIASARSAFRTWSLSTPQQRFDLLDQVGSTILARKNELGKLLAREEGKTLAEAVGEVGRAGQIFKFFAGEALRVGGEIVPSVRPGLTVEVTREPLGVIGLITPWNFPIAIPAWKIAPALAYGNCVVIKPAELVPGSVWELVKIIAEGGAPAGVINLVMGTGSIVGETLVKSADVDAISFTGLGWDRPGDRREMRRHREEVPARDGWQEPDGRTRRCRSGRRGRGVHQRRLLLHRPALYRI